MTEDELRARIVVLEGENLQLLAQKEKYKWLKFCTETEACLKARDANSEKRGAERMIKTMIRMLTKHDFYTAGNSKEDYEYYSEILWQAWEQSGKEDKGDE